MTKKVGHVSASSIATFKACPQRYRLAYVEGLRVAEEPQPLRMGTAWHKGLEILEMPIGDPVEGPDEDFDRVTPVTDDNRLELAVELATSVYTHIPDWADATDWAVEREIVANALAAYHWYHGNQTQYKTVAVELQFELPLVNPETGHSTPNFVRVGKMDRIVRNKSTGALLLWENKSTGKPIDSGSTYWARLRKDTQSKFYIVAARDLQDSGALLEPGCQFVSGLVHDVFHKPGIKPSKLTQADTKAFIETGGYCCQHFAVELVPDGQAPYYTVDGVHTEIEFGAEPKPKKDGTVAPRPFAIRESPAMYGARLFQDMTARPEFYFARREIAFTDAELLDFQYQVWALQKTMAEMERTGHWYENEANCEATFKCAYCPICYNNVPCFDGVTVPPGFTRKSADIQVEVGDAE